MLNGEQALTITPACEHKNAALKSETTAKSGGNFETRIQFACPDCNKLGTIFSASGPTQEGAILWSWDSPDQRKMLRAQKKSNAAASPKDAAPAKVGDPAKGLPGTEMLQLTAELGITSPPGCGCKGTAATMDRLGLEECRARITDLRLSIAAGWSAWGWQDKLKAVTASAWKAAGLGVNPTDPVRDLLEIALDRAEAKMKDLAT